LSRKQEIGNVRRYLRIALDASLYISPHLFRPFEVVGIIGRIVAAVRIAREMSA